MASDPSVRGHLIVKSHSPLPRFACAVPVPHPDATIDQLRTTIIAILTGQVSARTTSSSNGNGVKANEAPLSYSEHLKQVTIDEWRMKSLILELRQNSLIAPETREAAAEGNDGETQEEGISGFELQDDHECSLLEHGDEVNLWLRPGQAFESLRLPRLSSKHVYGLPKQPALDRSGTMLLSSNEASGNGAPSEFAFTSPEPLVRQPMEPSSHSSSVSANPDINFETVNRHWTVPNQQHRVVTVAALSGGNNIASTSKKQVRPLSKEKPKRLNSASYFSPQLVDQKQKEKYSSQRSKSGPLKTLATAATSQSPEQITTSVPPTNRSPEAESAPRSPGLASPALSPRAILSPNTTTVAPGKLSRQASSPSLGQSDAITSQLKARQASFLRAEKQERDSKMRKAVDQKKMPSGALIVGPGVQGKVGNLPPTDTRNGGIPERKPSGGADREAADLYGNRDAFVSFTAAGSDAYKPVRPHAGKTRRQSSRSATSDKEKVEKVESRRPSERRQSSFGKLMERKQSETSISKVDTPPAATQPQSTSQIFKPLLQPLIKPPSKATPAQIPAYATTPIVAVTSKPDATADDPTDTTTPATPPVTTRRFLDKLPAMPMPRLIRAASLSKSWQDLLQPLGGPFTPQTPSSQVRTSPVGERDETEPEKETVASPIYAMYTQTASTTQEEEPSSSHLQDTASSTQRQESIFSTPVEEEVTASSSSDGPIVTAAPSPPLTSRAEKRYQEVMKGIEVEREKQSQDERLRREAAIRRDEGKAKAKAKLEEDQQKRKETLKWQIWGDVRARQEKDKDRRR